MNDEDRKLWTERIEDYRSSGLTAAKWALDKGVAVHKLRYYINKFNSEATNKIMKTEFIYQNKFETLEELRLELAGYVYWYNNLRIHGSLGYLTPMEYRELSTLELPTQKPVQLMEFL